MEPLSFPSTISFSHLPDPPFHLARHLYRGMHSPHIDVAYQFHFSLSELINKELESCCLAIAMDAAGDPRIFPTQQQQVQVPTLLFPPSPLTPSSSSPASASASASHSHHHASASLAITSLPILILTVLGILTTSALLLTYYVFVIRCCLTWHASDDSSSATPASLIISLSRRRRRRTAAASSDDLPVVYGGTPAEARGLDTPAIQALPAFRYRTKAVMFKNVAAAAECAVCLGEFQEEERVRLLPSCLHIFHVDCIDTWLHGNANCPLCRAAAITTSTTHLPLSMDRHLQRQEEVVIQVQVAGAEEEEGITPAAGPQGDAADQHSSKGSPSEAAPPHCR